MYPLGTFLETFWKRVWETTWMLLVITYGEHVKATFQMDQKCSQMFHMWHMLWLHPKCFRNVVTDNHAGKFNQRSQCSQHVMVYFQTPSSPVSVVSVYCHCELVSPSCFQGSITFSAVSAISTIIPHHFNCLPVPLSHSLSLQVISVITSNPVVSSGVLSIFSSNSASISSWYSCLQLWTPTSFHVASTLWYKPQAPPGLLSPVNSQPVCCFPFHSFLLPVVNPPLSSSSSKTLACCFHWPQVIVNTCSGHRLFDHTTAACPRPSNSNLLNFCYIYSYQDKSSIRTPPTNPTTATTIVWAGTKAPIEPPLSLSTLHPSIRPPQAVGTSIGYANDNGYVVTGILGITLNILAWPIVVSICYSVDASSVLQYILPEGTLVVQSPV